MKKLTGILKGLDYTALPAADNITVSGVCFDSRKVSRGDLFISVKGTVNDGHKFTDEAVSLGAVAIICESLPENADPSVCWIKVEDSAYALGLCSSNFFDNPSDHIRL